LEGKKAHLSKMETIRDIEKERERGRREGKKEDIIGNPIK
jgi:hypothetical protein